MKINIENTLCPVCGYDLKTKIFNYENDKLFFSGDITGEICPSCGREFDFNLFPTEESYMKNRIEWIKSGMQYRNVKLKGASSDNKNPINQLKNIGINLLNPLVNEEYKKEIPNLEDLIKEYQ